MGRCRGGVGARAAEEEGVGREWTRTGPPSSAEARCTSASDGHRSQTSVKWLAIQTPINGRRGRPNPTRPMCSSGTSPPPGTPSVLQHNKHRPSGKLHHQHTRLCAWNTQLEHSTNKPILFTDGILPPGTTTKLMKPEKNGGPGTLWNTLRMCRNQ
jgi:hypothetical protein